MRTIEANFGIPINHVIQVDFGGLAGAVNALGGIYMSFPYPARTTGTRPSTSTTRAASCSTGSEALAVARSRHFHYQENGQWHYDGTSDFGRIDRQNQFLRALIDRAKSEANNLLGITNFLSVIPHGIAIDDTFGYNELLGLALKFHTFNPTTMAAYTLPTVSGYTASSMGDVLFVDQPVAQQMLVRIFGQVGTSGGPATDGPAAQPPAVPDPAAARGGDAGAGHPPSHHVTTSTQPI